MGVIGPVGARYVAGFEIRVADACDDAVRRSMLS